MNKLLLHKEVKKDLEEIHLLDSIASVRIVAFMQQVINDPDILKKLTTHCYRNYDETLDVKKWISMHEAGCPVWRLRFTDFAYRNPDYRIFYVISEDPLVIHIIAICKREDINYDDPNHPVCRRVARCCAELWRSA
ncbi:type II toxin-antitoxin system RelE/ParE family toxin [Castellaniella sp.]|uniref:type II toxin-antitoxin system RelE family toxin n=1 Tax=Castellaniella sp. TaxID=1955812 RepID=UPI002AFECFE1|nr:type II toxin-antitoxin system RelE/ParE family toxin [Castellaniella sp.]